MFVLNWWVAAPIDPGVCCQKKMALYCYRSKRIRTNMSTKPFTKHWPDLSFFSRPRRSVRDLSLSRLSASLLSRAGFTAFSSRPLFSRSSFSRAGLCLNLCRSHSRTDWMAAAFSLARDFVTASCGDASLWSRLVADRSATWLSAACDSVSGLAPALTPTFPPFFRNSNYKHHLKFSIQVNFATVIWYVLVIFTFNDSVMPGHCRTHTK